MATATKNARTLQASATNPAAETTTGAALDLTTALGLLITAQIANGATAPTTPCDFVVEVSEDGTSWREFSRQSGPTGNSESAGFVVQVPPEVLYARTVFEGNDDQDVTVAAQGHELTSIG